MRLRTGTLIPGTETPVGTGRNSPVRATIRVDSALHLAIVKRLPREGVLAECFCAMLFRGWGLPTPEPIIIHEHGSLIFGSLDNGYPNLAQRLGFSEELPIEHKKQLELAGSHIVCSWDDAPKATAVDEAIANADRNLGNVLWDGTDHAYIDHDRTLGLIAQQYNLLAEMAQIVGKAREIEQGAVAAALSLDTTLPSRFDVPDGVDFSQFVHYTQQRLSGLGVRLLNRFPKPDDLLTDLELAP
ncbi:MAG: hypothetical protein AB1412_11820 [Pseudomonadota bacterium]